MTGVCGSVNIVMVASSVQHKEVYTLLNRYKNPNRLIKVTVFPIICRNGYDSECNFRVYIIKKILYI